MDTLVDVARLDERLKAMQDTLHRIDENVERQNGRVRKLESWQSAIKGGLLVVGLVATAALGAAAKALIGG
ncbi:MAG TPA: hypothetical protein VFH17_05040 [Coriobacteriia bacterium]|nr:hypothetical protein [Coriobacteriia bacterium]